MHAGRDKWWHDEVNPQSADCPATEMDAEDMLFILYTSGSTVKPKGVVHTCGGYMVYTCYTFRNVFQIQDGDVYWCTADIGWITGHSYIVYGPLLAGATSIMFEGVPTYPDAGRFWEVCDKHQVTHFYTAPTAIRALQAQGDSWVEKHNLSSIKVLGSVGEPINEEAWRWYFDKVGHNKAPIVDTWWQTETGGILISPIAGITPLKPCFATLPLPGVQPCLTTPEGVEIEGNDVEGLLCIKFPWPSILRTTYGDHERCRQTYFSPIKGMYFTGDGARRDEDGYYRIIGRVDDVINVSGHRLGTAEVENAINQHPGVVESAVVGYPHDIKGQGIYAYVISTELISDEAKFYKEIMDVVSKEIGPIAKPDKIQIVSGLPKTRSGKIMRRILRKVAEGDTSNLGDTSTLLNPEVVEEIKTGAARI
jgi:acetyl-CoA synthetase